MMFIQKESKSRKITLIVDKSRVRDENIERQKYKVRE